MFLSLLLSASLAATALAENGLAGWLRYAPLPKGMSNGVTLPSAVTALNRTASSPVYTAGQELQQGLNSILGAKSQVNYRWSDASSIVVGTVEQYTDAGGKLDNPPKLQADGFWLNTQGKQVQILGQNERGALYGAFEYLSMVAQGNFSNVTYASNPNQPIRWVNQWDNLPGTIERGYGGSSIFFADGAIKQDLTRVAQYARLLASIGINGIIVNNVNANETLLLPENMVGLGRIADAMRPYGIQIGISLYFASPNSTIAQLGTFDPLDQNVIDWWTNVTDNLYKHVPDMAGYLIKANSEGQPGPLTYNRTLAQGANLFAKALQPYGSTLMFRAFVYDNTINETDWKADRANAAVDFFSGLDGKFDDNVVIQIKYGPIDFQVREPASPLFAYLQNTSTAIELEVTQEYLGQQDHLVYLPPLWKTILDFDFRAHRQPSLTSDIISGRRFKQRLGGSAAVVNAGTNTTWLGSHIAMSNLYAYGRLAWDPSSDSEAMLGDWTRLTFGFNQKVLDTINTISMMSWPAYENYTGNLGIQTLTDILYTHFGPNPASQDNNGWGQWTRADGFSIGMDRTVSNGTGFAGQYPPEIAQMYESIDTTPDNLLLWFHHVNYTHKLHSGETVIQHFYDAHYHGAEQAQDLLNQWKTLDGLVDKERYEAVLFKLKFQAGHAITWRDAINEFYHNLSGIPDEAGRVGKHPWRIEAENMTLDGYEGYAVNPFETASNFTAIVTSTNTTMGTVSAAVPFDNGKYDIAVVFFDLYNGTSSFTLSLNNKNLGSWVADNTDTAKLGHEHSRYLDGHSATRITFPGVDVKKGDMLKIQGKPNGLEPAPLDYVVMLPSGRGIVD